MNADEGTLRAAVEALADWLDSERDSIREAYLQHNAGRAEGRPVKRPDLATWGNAYEVAGRKVREVMSCADDVSVDRQAVVAEDGYEDWRDLITAEIGPLLAGRNLSEGGSYVKACHEIADALAPWILPLAVKAAQRDRLVATPTAAGQVTAARAVADEAAARVLGGGAS